MSEPEHVRETGRWLRFAHDDQRGAEALLERDDVPPRLACFLAQQAAEKSIKAALIFLQTEFPFRHDLDLLRDLLPDDWALKETPTGLGALSAWAARGRYPGDLYPRLRGKTRKLLSRRPARSTKRRSRT